jgi:hypothetical protein
MRRITLQTATVLRNCSTHFSCPHFVQNQKWLLDHVDKSLEKKKSILLLTHIILRLITQRFV